MKYWLHSVVNYTLWITDALCRLLDSLHCEVIWQSSIQQVTILFYLIASQPADWKNHVQILAMHFSHDCRWGGLGLIPRPFLGNENKAICSACDLDASQSRWLIPSSAVL